MARLNSTSNQTTTGVVTRLQSGFYTVATPHGSIVCNIRGRLKRKTEREDILAVGDRVQISVQPGGGMIEAIEPRQRALVRLAPTPRGEYKQVILANPDQVALVFACAEPQPRLRMLDRFLVICEKQRIPALIIANKVDLVGMERARAIFDRYTAIGYNVIYTSARQRIGLEALHDHLVGCTTGLAGPSGVGKSSLLNAIQPELGLAVREVSEATAKGRHTTIVRQMFALQQGGFVVDLPGLRTLALWDTEPEELDGYFPELRDLVQDCYFNNCTHLNTPDCAVVKAVAAGRVHPERYESYLRLRFGEEYPNKMPAASKKPALQPACLTWEMVTLRLHNPFRLAYGASDTRQAFILRLADNLGYGEGTIPPYYQIDAEQMIAFWREAARCQIPFPNDPCDVPAWVGSAGPAPARSAIDLALHDRIARQRGAPLFVTLGLPPPKVMPTSFTISIDTPSVMAHMALDMKAYPILKVKLGSDDDAARLAAIRAARPDARLRIDANAGWTYAEAATRIERLLPYQIELIEQPLARHEIKAMGRLQRICPVPIVADESVQSLQDVERLAAAGVQGINLKLMKVGGLSPAIAMLQRAQQLGLHVMLGCMVETSLGTTAMAHLSGAAEWIDLDAPLLIANDPFEGIRYDAGGNIYLPQRPGIGVVERATPSFEEQL